MKQALLLSLVLLILNPISSLAANYSEGDLTAEDHAVLARLWGTTDYEVFARIVTRSFYRTADGFTGGAPTINDHFMAFVCLERKMIDGDNRCESGFFKDFSIADSVFTERRDAPLRSFNEAIRLVKAIKPRQVARPSDTSLLPSFNVSRRAGIPLVYLVGVLTVPVDLVTTPFQLLVYGGSVIHARAQVRRMKRSILDFIRTGDRDGTHRLGSFVDLTRVVTNLGR